MIFNINNSLLAISQAEESFTNSPYLHGLNTGFIAYRLSHVMGKPEDFCKRALICGLIHDCGAASQEEVNMLLTQEEYITDIYMHCENGFTMLSKCSFLQRFATPIRYHHSDFRDVVSRNISPEDALFSSIIQLSDRFEVFLRKNNIYTLLEAGKEEILESQHIFSQFAGTMSPEKFYPGLIDSLGQLAELDDFWFYFRTDYVENFIRTIDFRPVLPPLDEKQSLSLARLFSTIVDIKSPFTYHHSLKVAELAAFLAHTMHLPAKVCTKIYLAGLLHDIGKINISDEILNKGGKLSAGEYRSIQRHVTDTRGILRYILTDENVINWASDHHERIDGSGYPLRKMGSQLSLPSRILAVTDVFQALCQHRPYRGALPLEKVMSIVRDACDKGQLCPQVFRVVEEHALDCFNIAK